MREIRNLRKIDQARKQELHKLLSDYYMADKLYFGASYRILRCKRKEEIKQEIREKFPRFEHLHDIDTYVEVLFFH